MSDYRKMTKEMLLAEKADLEKLTAISKRWA